MPLLSARRFLFYSCSHLLSKYLPSSGKDTQTIRVDLTAHSYAIVIIKFSLRIALIRETCKPHFALLPGNQPNSIQLQLNYPILRNKSARKPAGQVTTVRNSVLLPAAKFPSPSHWPPVHKLLWMQNAILSYDVPH